MRSLGTQKSLKTKEKKYRKSNRNVGWTFDVRKWERLISVRKGFTTCGVYDPKVKSGCILFYRKGGTRPVTFEITVKNTYLVFPVARLD